MMTIMIAADCRFWNIYNVAHNMQDPFQVGINNSHYPHFTDDKTNPWSTEIHCLRTSPF